jgi:hypothetical protein
MGTLQQIIMGLLLGVVVAGTTILLIVLIAKRTGYSPPKATDDYYSVNKGIEASLFPLRNDIDPKAGNLTILRTGIPRHGSVKNVGTKLLYTAYKGI